MFKKTLVMAAPVLASAALVAGGLSAGTGQANASGGHGPKAPVINATAKRTTVTACDGTVQKRTWNRGTNGWVYAGSDTGGLIVPGTILRVKGPVRGRDALSLNLSAESYLDTGSEGRVKVLLDGVAMAPSDVSTGSTADAAGYSTFAQNYCRNIGPGFHNLRVVISDYDYGQAGSYYFELKDPMVHVELSD